MRSMIPDYLAEAARVEPDASGVPTDDIPELAAAGPGRLGAAFAAVGGGGELVDPGTLAPGPDPGDGGRLTVLGPVDEALPARREAIRCEPIEAGAVGCGAAGSGAGR